MYTIDPAPVKDVFLYLRKSEQSKKRQVRSIEDQKADCLALAEQLSLNVVETFIEERSARKPRNRPQFSAMIKALSFKSPERRRADAILAWHPNRLSRNAEESGILVQRLDDNLIKHLYFPAYSFHNDSSGVEHLSMELARAKGYSDHLSDSVSRGTQNREKEGAMVYPAPFGYTKKREHPDPSQCSLFPIPHPTLFDARKMIVSLALERQSINQILKTVRAHFVHLDEFSMSHALVHKIINDEFNFGRWVVNRGQENERVVDLMNITLPDGTQFTPVCSKQEFDQIQCQKSGPGKIRNRRRINPLPNIVTCGHCDRKMYPSYRKIKKGGGVVEEQLGYECQYKDENGERCQQSRFKAALLFDGIESYAKEHQHIFTQKHYEKYVYTLKRFLAKTQRQMHTSQSSLTKQLQVIADKKSTLIQQKIQLSEKGQMDDVTLNHIDQQLKELDTAAVEIKRNKLNARNTDKERIVSFRQFLELLENLGHYWLSGDMEQKRTLSEKLLLNLVVKDKEIQSQTWIPLLASFATRSEVVGGGPACTQLEPDFSGLWRRYSDYASDPRQAEMIKDIEALVACSSPKFPLCDI